MIVSNKAIVSQIKIGTNGSIGLYTRRKNMGVYLIGLIVSLILIAALGIYIIKIKNKKQIHKMFLGLILLQIILCISLIAQILFANKYNIPPIYFEYTSFISGCFLPVMFLLTGLVFANTKVKFTAKHLLLFIIPTISLLLVWTNNFHHLMYVEYSISLKQTVFGSFSIFYNLYSYGCLLTGLGYLIIFSIKNAGFFSKQSILIVLGASIPIVLNVLGTFGIIELLVYITPISFGASIILFAFAILKFQFLNIVPVALQRINDSMSDGYIVLNEDMRIVDYNSTLIQMLDLKDRILRNQNINELCNTLKNVGSIDSKSILEAIGKTKDNTETVVIENYFDKIDKYFNIEINSISSKNGYIATLVLFKDTTQHMKDMEEIKKNQEIILRQEKFATLGELARRNSA